MAKFNYYLRDSKSTTPTPVVLFIRWNGQLLKFPTKQSVHPRYWDNSEKMIVDKKSTQEVKEIRRKLINDKALANELFTKFENDNKRTPTPKEFKKILESNLHGNVVIESEMDLLQYVSRFIEESKSRTNEKTGKPISNGTIDTYGQVNNSLTDYCNKNRKRLSFDDIDLDFYFDFHKYLVSEKLSTNTIGKRIALLKTILRDATERGVNKNLTYQSRRFKVTREKTDNIYLNESELMELYKLDLSNNKKLDNVRDLFLIGCYTALRWSDLSKLSINDIKDGFIDIEAQKTREKVTIPVHEVVKKILKKHDGKLPRALSNQKMNKYLKEMGELVESFHENTYKKITKGGQELTKRIEKYKRISTHTARRSFASNLFLDGIPSQTIMKITGHKSEKSFMTYIKITPQENANIIKMHWEKKSKLKLV